MVDSVDLFHMHLDGCVQCLDNPFDLCDEGIKLMENIKTESEIHTCKHGVILYGNKCLTCEREAKPNCRCNGMLARNALCGHIMFGGKKCGADDEVACEYKEEG